MFPVTFKFPNTFKFAPIVALPPVVIAPSFNNTLSIVTPELVVFSLIVSAVNVPVIDISPPDTLLVPPDNTIVELPILFFTSKSLKFPCLEAEIKFIPPTL